MNVILFDFFVARCSGSKYLPSGNFYTIQKNDPVNQKIRHINKTCRPQWFYEPKHLVSVPGQRRKARGVPASRSPTAVQYDVYGKVFVNSQDLGPQWA